MEIRTDQLGIKSTEKSVQIGELIPSGSQQSEALQTETKKKTEKFQEGVDFIEQETRKKLDELKTEILSGNFDELPDIHKLYLTTGKTRINSGDELTISFRNIGKDQKESNNIYRETSLGEIMPDNIKKVSCNGKEYMINGDGEYVDNKGNRLKIHEGTVVTILEIGETNPGNASSGNEKPQDDQTDQNKGQEKEQTVRESAELPTEFAKKVARIAATREYRGYKDSKGKWHRTGMCLAGVKDTLGRSIGLKNGEGRSYFIGGEAKNFLDGVQLGRIGYERLSSHKKGSKKGEFPSEIQDGDVIVFDYPRSPGKGNRTAGHIQIASGGNFYSDFRQRGFLAAGKYANTPFTIFRHQNKKKNVA